MNDGLSRRDFLGSAALATAGAMSVLGGDGRASAQSAAPAGAPVSQGPTRPIVIASGNGLRSTERAMAMIAEGADPLDAVIAGVNIVELDPTDHSVGYGGLPNEDGVVELDASVMHGPTGGAGAVAALRNIKTPSCVAKLVMERTDHVLLVGEGALRFAKAHGFKEEDLLTDEARQMWLKWKETLSDQDDWVPPPAVPDGQSSATSGVEFTYGTINCCAVDAAGNVAGVTTTSGLSYKIPGRVGDSPIIGAGLYVDNEVGAAGATGRGEACILNCASFAVVEMMRGGKSPTDACLAVLKRVADRTKDRRLLREDGRPNYDLTLYALGKDGRYGSAAIWSGAQFVVFSGERNRKEDCAFLFERPAEKQG